MTDTSRAAFEVWYANDATRQGFPMTQEAITKLRDQDGYGDHRTMLNGKWEGWQAALAAPQEPKVCRPDGRCQYAIDSGAEGLGHCPVGKCCMPDVEQTTHATNDEWLANCPQSVRDFAAKISKETKALVASVGETAQDAHLVYAETMNWDNR